MRPLEDPVDRLIRDPVGTTDALDPLRALRLIVSGRFGERQRLALLFALEGESVRAAAHAAGLSDHRTTWRHLTRLGLRELHARRRTEREKLAELRLLAGIVAAQEKLIGRVERGDLRALGRLRTPFD
jgi:hypothetical protein